jgi:hypothetical protein
MDAKGAGLIGGRRDHASLLTTANDDRFSLQVRVVHYLNSGIKGIHIQVNDCFSPSFGLHGLA